jgi:pyruvate/2-oxoglutarate dehydrogenase complex dihydrolipoamide dehydrogenase (E3) component
LATRHTAFREGVVAAQNACGHDTTIGAPAVPRPIYTDPEIASVGLTEAQARQRYDDDVATGTFPWVANARAVMQNETAGWVKSIHETRHGALLGLVMIGPHVTDMVEAGVIALDAGATAEIVADGMAPHPTLSEPLREQAWWHSAGPSICRTASTCKRPRRQLLRERASTQIGLVMKHGKDDALCATRHRPF